MKKTLLFVLYLLNHFHLSAQGILEGKVVDKDENGLEIVTALFQLKI